MNLQWHTFGLLKESVFLFLYLKRHVSFRFLIDRRTTRRITLITRISFTRQSRSGEWNLNGYIYIYIYMRMYAFYFNSLFECYRCYVIQYNLRWKFLELASKRVRSVREISNLFNLFYGVTLLGNHLTDSLLSLKISLKTVWTEQKLMSVDLAIYCTVKRPLSKTMQ